MTLGYARKPCSVVIVKKHLDESAIQDDVVPNETRSRTRIVAWRASLVVVAIAVPLASMTWTAARVSISARHRSTAPLLTVSTLAIGLVTWLQIMLSMNLLTTRRRTGVRFGAILLYVSASIAWLASSFAILQRDSVAQFATSLIGSLVSWLGFITLFNGNFLPPTRQQVGALPIILLLALLWEARTYFTNRILVDD